MATINWSFPSQGQTGNTYSDDPMDYVTWGVPLATPRTPGIAKVVVSDREQKTDEKNAAGQNGARLTTHGQKCGHVLITLTIWTQDQADAFDALWALVYPNTNKKALPVYDVAHPFLQLHRIKAVQVLGMSGPVPGPFAHSYNLTIKCKPVDTLSKKNVTATDEAPSTQNALTAASYPTPSQNSKNLSLP